MLTRGEYLGSVDPIRERPRPRP